MNVKDYILILLPQQLVDRFIPFSLVIFFESLIELIIVCVYLEFFILLLRKFFFWTTSDWIKWRIFFSFLDFVLLLNFSWRFCFSEKYFFFFCLIINFLLPIIQVITIFKNHFFFPIYINKWTEKTTTYVCPCFFFSTWKFRAQSLRSQSA